MSEEKNPYILTHTDLAELTGYMQGADIARCLRSQGIHVFNGKQGRVWTTIQLINMAGGLTGCAGYSESPREEGFDPI